MKKFYLLILLGSLSGLFLTACSSYMIRKECEKLNWYQVGFDAAMRGERISQDEAVSRCRKADAEMSESQLDVGFKAGASKYCQPDTVFQTGKNGEPFNSDFCDSSQNSTLRAKHSKGIEAYCQASNGMTAGLSGRKYQNVCSADLEKSFLPQFRAGRKKYLLGMTRNLESQISTLERDLNRITDQKRRLDSQLASLPPAQAGEGDPFSARRHEIQQQSWQMGHQMSQKQLEKSKLEKEIDGLRRELVTLE